MLTIVVAKEFSDSVGGRYKEEGNFSGEEFRETLLKAKFEEALKTNQTLLIDFDGGYGYPTSFLEESFGGLVRDGFDKELVIKTLMFKSDDNPKIIERAKSYILEAKNEN